MELLKLTQQITDIGKSSRDKQAEISVAEVWHIHTHLSMRYDVLETTNIFKNFVKSTDFDLILKYGTKVLLDQIEELEKLTKEYGITIPNRPPLEAKSITKIEAITDRHIFRQIFRGIQSFIPSHSLAFIHSTSPKLRENFKRFLLEELDLYDKFFEYGKLKGFELIPPVYAK